MRSGFPVVPIAAPYICIRLYGGSAAWGLDSVSLSAHSGPVSVAQPSFCAARTVMMRRQRMEMPNGRPDSHHLRLGSQDAAGSAASSVSAREASIELLAQLYRTLSGEAAADCECGHRREGAVLSARQAPVVHARCRVADIFEAVHDVAGDEDDSPWTDRRDLAADRQLIGTFDDEKRFFLAEMDMIRWALAGFVPCHDDRDDTVGGFGREEHSHIEAEGFDPLRLLRVDNDGLS